MKNSGWKFEKSIELITFVIMLNCWKTWEKFWKSFLLRHNMKKTMETMEKEKKTD